jgi:hypothetical protein
VLAEQILWRTFVMVIETASKESFFSDKVSTNSTEHSSSWEADSFSAGEDFSLLLLKQKARGCVQEAATRISVSC